MGSFWGHLHTINHHRRLVRQGCFRMGLYWQGLTHDLSKYAPVEFLTGVRYYQGTRSPNTAEREEKGWSEAWMHHKGRNRHHWEYWTDLDMQTKAYAAVPMPPKYLAEMVADRIAAALTPVTRRAILQLKYDTPDDVKIAGIEYYVAVLRDGVRTYDAFAEWRRTHPLTGIVEWMP